MAKKRRLVCPYCGHANGIAALLNLKISVSSRTHMKLPGWKCKVCDGRMRLAIRFTKKLWLFAAVFWLISFPLILVSPVDFRRFAFGITFIMGFVLEAIFMNMYGIIEPVLLTPNAYGKIDFDNN